MERSSPDVLEGFEVFSRTGYTSIVYRLEDQPLRVCKAFITERAERLYNIEKAVYERFSANNPPPSILQYYGVHEKIPLGIVLELAEEDNVAEYLWQQREVKQQDIPRSVLYRWASQAAEALAFAHSLDIYNSDIHCINFFLDSDLNLKVGDWAGAEINGSRSLSSYRLQYRLFAADGTDVPRSKGMSASTEIFALGTALYYMVTGHNPWPELRERESRAEIEARIAKQNFPNLSGLPLLSSIILRCWRVDFATMNEVRAAIVVEAGTSSPN